MSEESAHVSGVALPLTDGAVAGTWRGETDASVLHRVDLAMVLAHRDTREQHPGQTHSKIPSV